MKREHFVMFLIVSLVFVTGINGCENLGLQRSGVGYDEDGLKMEFISGVTPTSSDKLTDFSQFQVGVSLRSSMLNDIDGELRVYDSLSDTYGGISDNERQLVGLVAAERVNDKIKPAPEEEFIFPSDFGTYSYTNLQQGLSLKSSITAVLLYNVEAVADTQLCLKRDARVEVKDIPCDDYEVITNLNVNPAPVIVGKIEKRVLYGGGGRVNVNLDIYLKKIDKGEVVSKDALYNRDEEMKNDLNYEVGFAGGQRFVCNPREKIRFDENEKVIRCSATLNIQQDYINDPFIVVLSYGFRESITTGAIDVRKEII